MNTNERKDAAYFESKLCCMPDEWFEDTVAVMEKGSLLSPDELAAESTFSASERHAKARKLYAELMCSEAAKPFLQEAAKVLANFYGDEDEEDEIEDDGCSACNGTGEGGHEGQSCMVCRGTGY